MLVWELVIVYSFLYSVIVVEPPLEPGTALYIKFRVNIPINSALGPPLLIPAIMHVSHMAALWLGKDNPYVFRASFLLRSVFCSL